MWDRFFRQRAYIGITRSCMRWYVRKKIPSRGSPIGITRLAEWWQWVIARDGFFYPILTRVMDSFSCSPLLKYLIYIGKKNLKKTSRESWIHWDATWWRHFKITMTSRIDVRPACGCSFFLPFPRAGTGVWDLTYAIIYRLSRKGFKHWLYWDFRTWSSIDVIVMLMWRHHVKLHLNLFSDFLKLILK